MGGREGDQDKCVKFDSQQHRAWPKSMCLLTGQAAHCQQRLNVMAT